MEKLVQDLGKQIWYICSRALEAVCDDNATKQLVSALRIIEREERFDNKLFIFNLNLKQNLKHNECVF